MEENGFEATGQDNAVSLVRIKRALQVVVEHYEAYSLWFLLLLSPPIIPISIHREFFEYI